MGKLFIYFGVFLAVSFVHGQSCGIEFKKVSCDTGDDPCCSDQGFCGRSAQHCGGGCQPKYSFVKGGDSKSSCLAYRPGGQQCISGRFDFSNSTWLIPSDAYNGNPKVADFTVDRQGLEAGNLLLNSESGGGSGLNMALRRPDGNTPGIGLRLSSTSYLPYGIFSAQIQQSGVAGVVTSFISMGDDKDEIDWEWTGHKPNSAWTNFFTILKDYGKGIDHNLTTSTVTVPHVYTIDWSPTRINWLIDGDVIRTVLKSSDPDNYPTQPSRVQIGIWDGGAGAPGTSQWAGGRINWGSNTNFYSGVDWVKIQCPGDPDPTGPPTRPPGYSKPSLKDAAIILSVVENTKEYVPGTVGTQAPLPSPIRSDNGGINISPVNEPGKSESVDAGSITVGLAIFTILSAIFATWL